MKFSLENDLSAVLKETIIKKAQKILLAGDSICVAAMLNSLNNMNYQWKNEGPLEEAICQGIVAAFHPVKRVQTKAPRAREICSCVHFLGELAKGLVSDSSVESDKEIILSNDVMDSLWAGIENQWRAFFPERIHEIFQG
jgi:hypothetical protein